MWFVCGRPSIVFLALRCRITKRILCPVKASLAGVFVWLAVGTVAVVHAVAEGPDFARYQVILMRMPFGAEIVTPPGGANAPAAPPAELFTKNLKMCAVTRNARTGVLQVGMVDAVTKKTYFLKKGDEEDGILLVDADYEKEKALLRKGTEEVWITMSSGAGVAVAAAAPAAVSAPPALGTVRSVSAPVTTAVAAPAPAGTPSAAPGGMSLSERFAALRMRRTESAAKAPQPAKAITISEAPPAAGTPPGAVNTRSPEELEKHLQEYQMDIIRSGGAKGPPLPLPLTPEMDQKLVDEGVLPPP